MARAGRKFPLVIYQKTIDGWWHTTSYLTIFLLVIAGAMYWNPEWRVQSLLWLGAFELSRWMGVLAVSGISFLFTLILLILRNLAYVQVLPTHLKLATPFLLVKISYKRIRRATTTEMRTLFPPDKTRGWKRELMASLGGRTAVVLELNGWPVPPKFLRVFLSPFFFKDTTPHFVILVDDWIRFSTELESARSREGAPKSSQTRKPRVSILSRLPRQ